MTDKHLELLTMLETHTLDPAFEAYGNFAEAREGGKTHFHGNFADVSAVFDFVLEGDEAARVEIEVRRHQRSERYLAEKRRRRTDLVVSWARRQTDRWGHMTGAGRTALRLAEDGQLERAEKVMARAS